jgi:hypothetical protein
MTQKIHGVFAPAKAFSFSFQLLYLCALFTTNVQTLYIWLRKKNDSHRVHRVRRERRVKIIKNLGFFAVFSTASALSAVKIFWSDDE